MRKPLRVLIAILDRKPGGSRGQSLVELTITLPLFLLMLLGMVEVGWLANNYLTLVDITREAGRYGSIRDPIRNWTPGDELSFNRMDCDTQLGSYNTPGEVFTAYPGPPLPGYTAGNEGPMDYYDGIACTVLANMSPLEFKHTVDDIVISVISYAVVDTGGGVLRASVTGRYPARSNECPDDGRDPFAPPWLPADQRDPLRYDDNIDFQRGYLFRGNHRTDENCLGSEFSIGEIEDLLNQTLVDSSGGAIRGEEIQEIPNNAIVLVEIFWAHEQLLGLPFFTWAGNPIPIYVWTFFPVTAAEPTPTPSN